MTTPRPKGRGLLYKKDKFHRPIIRTFMQFITPELLKLLPDDERKNFAIIDPPDKPKKRNTYEENFIEFIAQITVKNTLDIDSLDLQSFEIDHKKQQLELQNMMINSANSFLNPKI